MLIHLSGKLCFQFLRFFQVRSNFLFLPEFSVDTLSDRKKQTENNNGTKTYPQKITTHINHDVGCIDFILIQTYQMFYNYSKYIKPMLKSIMM